MGNVIQCASTLPHQTSPDVLVLVLVLVLSRFHLAFCLYAFCVLKLGDYFSEDIGNHLCGWDPHDLYSVGFYEISDEVVSYVDVFGLGTCDVISSGK